MALLNNPSYHLAESIYEFTVRNLNGEPVKLSEYNGHVCIIVNTASRSPLTDLHYKQFNKLMETFGKSEGLRILAFPCNQFGREEPCTTKEIAKHVKENKLKFDVFAKINVNCNNASPLYKFMKRRLRNQEFGNVIKWNYTKFIINKSGIPVKRYGPEILPEEMIDALKSYFTNVKTEAKE